MRGRNGMNVLPAEAGAGSCRLQEGPGSKPGPPFPRAMRLLDRPFGLVIASHRVRLEFRRPRVFALGPASLFPTPAMAGDSALAARVARLLARPLVRGSLLVSSLAAFAGNFPLLASIHRSKSTIFLGHGIPPSRPGSFVPRRALHGRPPPTVQPRCHERIDSVGDSELSGRGSRGPTERRNVTLTGRFRGFRGTGVPIWALSYPLSSPCAKPHPTLINTGA